MMIKLLKEKFYDKLQRQVKQLKEDKLLLNLVNASLWGTTNKSNNSTVAALTAAAAASSLSLNDRRSLRKRDFHLRFTAGEADDLLDSGLGSTLPSNGRSGESSSGKRRRQMATRYSSNDEHSSGLTGSSYTHHLTKSGSHGAGSGNDSNLSDKDYDALNSIIMNSEDGGAALIFENHERVGSRPKTRGSSKQFVGVQGLRPEELNDDLDLLRMATTKI